MNAAEDHVSMKDRHDNQVTLEDCVELFSKEYVLWEWAGVAMVTIVLRRIVRNLVGHTLTSPTVEP